jgi:hypothetical protein
MHHRRLITPVEKVWHRRPVRRRCHVASHTLLAVPSRHGPKCPFAIGQNRSALKSGGAPDLTAGAEEVHSKGGQEADRSHPQTSYADKRHSQVSRRRGRITLADSGCCEPILVSQIVSGQLVHLGGRLRVSHGIDTRTPRPRIENGFPRTTRPAHSHPTRRAGGSCKAARDLSASVPAPPPPPPPPGR